MDRLTPEERSRRMASVRSKDTGPERLVRSMAHRLGFRFRLHRRDLPGQPDLVFPRLRKVILVHGCFWHRHSCPAGRAVPKTRTRFWCAKFDYNRSRDARNLRRVRREGWDTLVIWECETKDRARLASKLRAFLVKTA